MIQIPLKSRWKEKLPRGGYRVREETIIGFRLSTKASIHTLSRVVRSLVGVSIDRDKRSGFFIWSKSGKPRIYIAKTAIWTSAGQVTKAHQEAAHRAATILITNGLANGRRNRRDVKRVSGGE